MSEKIDLSQLPPGVIQPTPGDQGYVPPVDAVPLPSKGKIYPSESPLGNAETVEIRAMTAAEEDILTSAALLKQGKAISTLMRSCLVNKLIDPDQLIIGDRNAIMFAIRITGYGPEYRVPVTCPSCGVAEKEHEFDLRQLAIKPLGREPDAIGANCFTCSLPVTKQSAVVKLLTGADDREIETATERARKAGSSQENTITTRLFHSIVSLGGETNPGKLSNLIRRLPARDSLTLRKFIEETTPGVKAEQDFTCRACGETTEVDVPMGAEFFWPSR